MIEHAADIRSLKITLAGYLSLFALQLSAYFLTNILVLLAEALHTLSDVLISTFLLFAVF